MINWLTFYFDCKYVTERKACNYLLDGKSTWRGCDNRWSQDIDFGWFDTLRGQSRVSSVECRVSVHSGELRSAQLGSSEWCTLRPDNKYVIPNLVLAVSWLHARSTTPRAPCQPRIRVYQLYVDIGCIRNLGWKAWTSLYFSVVRKLCAVVHGVLFIALHTCRPGGLVVTLECY